MHSSAAQRLAVKGGWAAHEGMYTYVAIDLCQAEGLRDCFDQVTFPSPFLYLFPPIRVLSPS